MPRYTSGSSTFSSAVVRGSRLNPWKMKPMRRFRSTARASFERRPTSMPARRYAPRVGRSRHPMMFIIVLLPEPLVPTIAHSSPALMPRFTSRSARTTVGPDT
jgi:hypothetical protein